MEIWIKSLMNLLKGISLRGLDDEKGNGNSFLRSQDFGAVNWYSLGIVKVRFLLAL